MALLKCQTCGGSLVFVSSNEEILQCECCGNLQTLPKYDDDLLTKRHNRATQLRRNNEFDKADYIYEEIIRDFPDDALAYWSRVLCKFGVEYVEDPSTKKFIPTVHRVQHSAVQTNEDYKQALQLATLAQKMDFIEKAKQIDEIRSGIIALSTELEEPFDVFISYKETDDFTKQKTKDFQIAFELYNALTNYDLNVFFSHITLQGKIGSEYEPYIFAALQSSKVMIVLGTKPEHFEAVWVRNEWSRYLDLIDNGTGKKFLIPAYHTMNPADLPIEIRGRQAQNLAMPGAILDLAAQVNKIVENLSPKKKVMTSTVNMQSMSSDQYLKAEVGPLLQRAYLSMEEGDFIKADELLENALNKDPEHSETYLAKMMVDLGCPTKAELKQYILQVKKNKFYPKIVKYADDKMKRFLDELFSVTKSVRYILSETGITTEIEPIDTSSFAEHLIEKGGNLIIKNCSAIKKLTISPNTVEIAANAFSDCKNLTEIVIPSGVTTIGENAFNGCSSLVNVSISETVNSIGAGAFDHCTSIKSVSIGNIAAWCKIRFTDAFSNPVRYAKTVTLGGSPITDLVIPDGVVSIGSHAFRDCTSIKSLRFPSTVVSIGEFAFGHCSSVVNISLPGSVREIGNYAFYNCGAITNLTVGSAVKSIGSHAFEGCGLLTNLAIPGNVESVGENAFKNCLNLASLNITHGVKSIGSGAFEGCKALRDIATPSTVVSIGDSAFADCKSVTSIRVDGSDATLGGAVFKNCSELTDATIGSGIKAVGHSVFSGCNKLTRVSLPDGLKAISACAFENCEALASISLSDNITTIESEAFKGCSTLKEINLPKNLGVIEAGAFAGCKLIKDLIIPDSVNSIGDSSFAYCSALENVTLGKSLTSIGKTAFSECNNINTLTMPNISCSDVVSGCDIKKLILTGEITAEVPFKTVREVIITSATSICDNAFSECTELVRVEMSRDLKAIGESAFDGCSSLKEITIPGTVSAIGDFAFSDCTSLEYVQIESGVTAIGDSAFAGCSSIKEISIPSSVKTVGDSAFEDCSGASNIYIESGVETIGSSAFENCESVTRVMIPHTVKTVGSYAFMNCASLASVTIDNGVGEIEYAVFKDCISLESIEIPDSVSELDTEELFSGCTALTSVTLPASLKELGKYTFSECTSLEGITLPRELTAIDESAFFGCTALANISLPNEIAIIKDSAFKGCSKLSRISLPAALTTLGKSAFADCTSISSISFPRRLKSIDDLAFSGCKSLREVTLPDNVSVAYNAFNSTGLTSMSVPARLIPVCTSSLSSCQKLRSVTVTSGNIPKHAFKDCSSLENITLLEGVNRIEVGAFQNCTGLTTITIPKSVYSIGDSAFYGCRNLKVVKLLNKHTEVTRATFAGCKARVKRAGYVLFKSTLAASFAIITLLSIFTIFAFNCYTNIFAWAQLALIAVFTVIFYAKDVFNAPIKWTSLLLPISCYALQAAVLLFTEVWIIDRIYYSGGWLFFLNVLLLITNLTIGLRCVAFNGLRTYHHMHVLAIPFLYDIVLLVLDGFGVGLGVVLMILSLLSALYLFILTITEMNNTWYDDDILKGNIVFISIFAGLFIANAIFGAFSILGSGYQVLWSFISIIATIVGIVVSFTLTGLQDEF